MSENCGQDFVYGNVIGETGGRICETHRHLHSTKFKQSSAIMQSLLRNFTDKKFQDDQKFFQDLLRTQQC